MTRSSVALGLAAVGLWALFLGFLGLHLVSASDGARLAPGAAPLAAGGLPLEPLRPGSLQPGDVLLAINGHSLTALAEALTQPQPPGFEWAAGQTLRYTLNRAGAVVEVPVTLGPYPLGAVLAANWGSLLFALLLQLATALLFWRRPAEPVARGMFLASAAMLAATNWSLGLQVSDLVSPAGFWLYSTATLGGYLLVWAAALHVTLLFPTPWPPLARWRWLAPLLYAAPLAALALALVLGAARAPNALAGLAAVGPVTGYTQGVYSLLALAGVVRGFRAARDPVARAQVRWVAAGLAITLFTGLAFGVLPEVALGYPLLSWDLLALIGLLVPLGFAIAILRYRLFDIDVLLNRALVYGGLSAAVIGLYVLVVGGLGTLLGAGPGGGRLVLSLLVTALVAVFFQPVRERLQRAVNRLLYGERDDPYRVLSRLGQRLEAALAPEAVLPALVETIGQTLKLPYVAVALHGAGGGAPQTAAAYGRPSAGAALTRLPLVYQGEPVGELVSAARGPGEAFTPAEQRLLEDMARQAGAAAHAVRLTADLQRSRERLVGALEEERRRLRRDLHDGLGPQLASQTLTLTAARQLLRQDPARAEALLADAILHAQAAVTDIRRVVYALRPPALDDLGLAGALRAQAAEFESSGVRFSVSVPEALPPLPAAVEVACYRIAQEAMTNVVKHAHAQNCALTVTVTGGAASASAIALEVLDDGQGLPAQCRAGVGLGSMRERAAELGGECQIAPGPAGGTRVLARLPLAAPVKQG